MKIKIAENGNLYIWRVNRYRPQFCLYDSGHQIRCADWCPQFELKKGAGILNICQKRTLSVEDVIDLREKGE
ncbi:hypothetical protein KAU11_11435 [Candidatus Babeliales bacterium]|nr:hypothetical protein [Candidatus Babeliales bacterium]